MSIKLAILGYGAMGREHLRVVRASGRADLVAVSDIDDGALRSLPSGIKGFTDYRELLEDTSLDGAIVALPNNLHFDAGMAAIRCHLPVFMEKPIASDLRQARLLVDAAAAADVPILVGHHRRHAPDLQAAKRVIGEGRIGRLLAVSGMWLARKSDRYFDVAWRRAKGGGPIFINLVHDLDVLRFLCGEISSVQAMVSSHGRGLGVEDTVALTMRFANGAIGTFLLSDAVPAPYSWDGASRQAINLPHHPTDCYVFGGDKGTLAVPSMSLWSHRDGGSWTDPITWEHVRHELAGCHARQLDNFLDVIDGHAEPSCSGKDGFASLLAASAVSQAALTESAVAIDEGLLAEAGW